MAAQQRFVMMKRAFVHIGLPKTGTTAIQEYFSQNRKFLRSNGVLYPGSEVDHVDLVPQFHQVGSRHFFFSSNGLSEEETQRKSAACLEGIRQESLAFEGDVVLSSEYFYDLSRPAVKKLNAFFDDIGRELQILCYVRHPIAMATSSTQQSIKMGTGRLGELLRKPKWHSIKDALFPYVDVLGKERIAVRSFDLCRDTGAALDLLDTIGFSASEPYPEQIRSNESLSAAAVLLADAHNQLSRLNAVVPKSKGYYFKIGGPKFSLPFRTRKLVLEACEGDLTWLKECFGIELEAPALDPKPFRALSAEAALDIVSLLANSSRGGKA